ncbi:MAG: hypothetical protein JW963_17905 [Anaerolineales bacterium]|nr:hypothetical protein [Anaerolineales bacterium]
MDVKRDKAVNVAGGICAILWPILSELLFYTLYPILAGSAKIPPASSFESYLIGAAELGHNPSILALEWSKVAMPLLLLPFLLALYRFMSQRDQQNLAVIAVGLGFVSMVFTMLGSTFNSVVNHALGNGYVSAGSDTERDIILSTARVFSAWHGGINQTASLLYQGCVGLMSLALLRNRTWRFLGWLGLVGALLAIPAKIPLGWQVPTNFIWTGIAYFFWPVGLGIGLIKAGRCVNSERSKNG